MILASTTLVLSRAWKAVIHVEQYVDCRLSNDGAVTMQATPLFLFLTLNTTYRVLKVFTCAACRLTDLSVL